MYRFAFVLEQTLGHVAHGLNIERALKAENDIVPDVIRVDFAEPSGMQRLPGFRTWSWRASVTARNELRQSFRRGALDGVFIHTQVASLLAGDIMRAVPTIVSLDATPRVFDREGEAYGHQRDMAVIEMLKQRFNMRAFAGATRLVTWCQWAAYSLVAEYGVPREKIDVIPPGVDLELFRPALHAKRAERLRILFVGGQFERKGGADLLEAARGLGDAVEVDIVTGDSALVVPAGMNVRVHRGLKPQSDRLLGLYRSADIFALPSRGDCMPQAVSEAIACGLPVVATRVGAIPEMVTDCVNGYLVPPRDPRALRGALAALVEQPRRRTLMGHHSRVMAEEAFDARRNNRRIFGLMRQLAASTGVTLRTA